MRYIGFMWKKIIHELIDSGLTQTEIAAAVGTSQSHVSALLNGDRQEPRYALGERIRALHAQRCAELSEGE